LKVLAVTFEREEGGPAVSEGDPRLPASGGSVQPTGEPCRSLAWRPRKIVALNG
jgi:hypothetical protein